MNVYAIKDRMLAYFLKPFVAANDQEVLASIADTVNNQESPHAITKAPHHFEIWKLARIEEDGTVIQDKDYLADASSLVREPSGPGGRPGASHSSIRRRAPHSAQNTGHPGEHRSPPSGAAQIAQGNEPLARTPPESGYSAPQAQHPGPESAPGHSER